MRSEKIKELQSLQSEIRIREQLQKQVSKKKFFLLKKNLLKLFVLKILLLSGNRKSMKYIFHIKKIIKEDLAKAEPSL
jgi:hypothetical protein